MINSPDVTILEGIRNLDIVVGREIAEILRKKIAVAIFIFLSISIS